jgi:hypothetical protein
MPNAPACGRSHSTDSVLGGLRNKMEQLFAVIRSHGPAWLGSRPMEGQEDWDAYASFMNGLEREGFVVLGGP